MFTKHSFDKLWMYRPFNFSLTSLQSPSILIENEIMTIRLEKTEDYREVENLTREAFWNVYRPGCTEHYVLNQYRNNPDFIPELDFVMEEDGKIIGHVMFSKAEIMLDDGASLPSWTFGPISIHPDYKRKGYGLKLLQYALEKAKKMGIGLLCMEGNIEFYKNAGFDLASKLKIHYHAEPRESEVPYFLAQELIPGYWGNREGTYCPPKGYFAADENPEAFEAYEATFPKKERHSVRVNSPSSVRVAVCRSQRTKTAEPMLTVVRTSTIVSIATRTVSSCKT